METEVVKTLIEKGFDHAEVIVHGDGSHFEATVISDEFEGKNRVKKQQMVYATVNDKITNGELHALSIKTYTKDEWQQASKLQVS